METSRISESHCFVCSFQLDNESESNSSRQASSPLSILQKQLQTVFFMRNILELPVKKLVNYLKSNGDPEHWINFCASCRNKIENVRELFTKLQKISRKYEEARSEVLEKMEDHHLKSKKYANPGIPGECRKWASKSCKRTFLKIRSNDCFADGDKEASRLASKLEAGGQTIIQDHNHDGFKFEFANTNESLPLSSEDNVKIEVDDAPIPSDEDDMLPLLLNSEGDNDHHEVESDNSSINNESGSSTSEEEWTSKSRVQRSKRKYTVRKPRKVRIKVNHQDPSQTKKEQKEKLANEDSVVNQNLYSCSLCEDKTNLEIDKFTKHIYQVHQSQYKCAVCPRGFPVWDDVKIRSHWSTHHKQQLKEILPASRVKKVDPLLPEIIWPCPACPNTTFTNEDLRDVHLETCENGRHAIKPVSCEACSKTYSSEDELKLHIVLVHPGMFKETQFKCEICFDFFSTESKFRRHKIRSHGADKYSCNICGQDFLEKKSLQFHQQSKHGGKTDLEKLTCEFCHKLFACERNLKLHVRTVHEEIKETCTVCGQEFKSLRSHLPYKHGIKMGKRLKYYYCVSRRCNCKKAFPDLKSIMEHLESKSHQPFLTPSRKRKQSRKKMKQDKHVCDLCGASRLNSASLDFHKAKVHKIGKEKYSCKDCGIFLGIRASNSKAHACGVIRKKVLKKRTYICDYCGYCATQKGSLNRHLKSVHEKDFKFVCDLCPFRTNHRNHLARHKASLHGIGDYQCKMEGCTRVFGNQKHMEQHFKFVHEGKKPKDHICSFCGAGFYRLDRMKRHILALHTNKGKLLYHCEVCGKGFSMPNYVKVHMKTHNKN